LRKITQSNLEAAFAGESQAHMKYLIFATQAEREYPNLARLYRAIAFAEQVHATNHFRVLGHIGSAAENAQTAIEGETFEVEEMYPAYYEVAKLQEEKNAQRTTNWALEAEKGHAVLYGSALESVKKGKDPAFGTIHVCMICGYTVDGEAPDECPVCRAKKDKFKAF